MSEKSTEFEKLLEGTTLGKLVDAVEILIPGGSLTYAIVFAVLAYIVYRYTPVVLKEIVKKFKTSFDYRNQDKIARALIVNAPIPSWIASIPSLSSLGLKFDFMEVFVPPKFLYRESSEIPQSEVSLERILSRELNFAVVGPPGCGKSTVASYIAHAFAADRSEDLLGIGASKLPIFIKLKDIANLKGALPSRIGDFLNLKENQITTAFIESQLKIKNCVIVLDGLDEVEKSRRRNLVDWLFTTINSYQGNIFILTSRSKCWEDYAIPNLAIAKVLEFDVKRRTTLIEKWEAILPKPIQKETKVVNPIDAYHLNDALADISSNPMLLTIMVILNRSGFELPMQRNELFDIFLSTMLGEWDELKNLIGSKVGTVTIVEQRTQFLESLAYKLVEDGQFKDVVNLEDKATKRSLKQITDSLNIEASVDDYLAMLVSRTGLVDYGPNQTIYFSNRRFFEILLARYYARDDRCFLLTAYLGDNTWSEVIEQTFERSTYREEFLKRIIETGELSDTVFRIFIFSILNNIQGSKSCLNAMRHEISIAKNLNKYDQSTIRKLYRLDKEYWDTQATLHLQGAKSIFSNKSLTALSGYTQSNFLLDILKKLSFLEQPNLYAEFLESLPSRISTDSSELIWTYYFNIKGESTKKRALLKLSSGGELAEEFVKNKFLENTENAKKGLELFSDLEDQPFELALRVLCKSGWRESLAFINKEYKNYSLQKKEAISRILNEEIFQLSGYTDIFSALDNNKSRGFYLAWGKRVFDVFSAAFVLTIMSPLIILISLAIKLSSKGPVLFKQTRLGKEAKTFIICKFSTMKLDDESYGAQWASVEDPRITNIGKILRRLRLDNLPCFYNVLKGDLSIVGPRAERPEFSNHASREIVGYQQLLTMRPGLTSFASVYYPHGGSIEDLQRKYQLDIVYGIERSFIVDMKTIYLTIYRAIFQRYDF